MFEAFDQDLLWILCVAFIIAFILAFSVGANDVSNSFGTSVGSGVLTVTQACILATFFEVAGATLLGYSVCDTFRKKMYDVELYKDSQKELMLGALSCLIGSSVLNLIATAFKMPISGTHSIVGAMIGFSIVLRGWSSVKWFDILKIVISWFASPILSGFLSSIIYLLISRTVIRKVDPLRYGLKALPLFYGSTIFINVASVVINGPEVLNLNKLPWYAGLFISLVFAGVAICCVAMILVPKLRRQITDELTNKNNQPSGGILKKPATKRLAAPTVPAAAGGYDNEAFKSDLDVAKVDELTLDPSKLQKSTTGSAGTGAGETGGTVKPPLAPKPVHLLKRQNAQDHHQLEEIDLRVEGSSEKSKNVKGSGKKSSSKDIESFSGGGHNYDSPKTIGGERIEIFRLFSSLQIMTACFASFAHGTNDVSNAVAPLIPIWNIFSYGAETTDRSTQVWILAFGGIGICAGLWAWGRSVMGTVGHGLTQLTPSKGFAIELGAAVSVLVASKLGLPISTTHCKVGSVVIVGVVSSKFCSQDNLLAANQSKNNKDGKELEDDEVKADSVNWKMFRDIVITWILTVPIAAAASMLTMVILQKLVL